MKKLLFILCFSSFVLAGTNQNEASLGMQYVYTLPTYELVHKVIGCKPVPSFIFATLLGLAIGTTGDIMGRTNSNSQILSNTAYRTVGGVAAGITIWSFDL